MVNKSMACVVMCGLAFAAVLAGPARANDEHEVERANAAFYTSLNSLFVGDSQPMKHIWSHRDDVTYMGPAGGYQIGWNQVNDAWEKQAAMKLGGEIGSTETRIVVGNDMAVVHCFEEGNHPNVKGHAEQVSIRATNIFRKENGEWKMIGHHTDRLPFLEKEEEELTRSVDLPIE